MSYATRYDSFMNAASYQKYLRKTRLANAAKFDRKPLAKGWYAPQPIANIA